MVTKLHRPRDLAEAQALLRERGGALPLAGGTYLLTGQFAARGLELVLVEGLLPRGLARAARGLEIGAGTTFQELLDAPGCPALLAEAARGMASRNVRNRATVGGNLGAAKSCGSLAPALLALGAELELADGSVVGLEAWLGKRAAAAAAAPGGVPALGGEGLVLKVLVPARPGTRAAYGRWSRTSCDVAVLTASVAYRVEGGRLAGLRVAAGGLGPAPKRLPEVEALFEGKPLPSREEAEKAMLPLLAARADLRGSAEFKRLRAAQLISEALRAAEEAR